MSLQRALAIGAVVMAATATLAGCSSSAPASTVGGASANPHAKVDPVKTTATSNAHGLTPVKLGEPVSVNFPGKSTPAFTITVNSVTKNYKCTGDGFTPPTTGQIDALHVTVVTDPNYEKITFGAAPHFFWQDFHSYASATATAVPSPPDWVGCVNDDNPAPNQDISLGVPAGATTNGLLFISAPANATSFSWTANDDFDVTTKLGWEWPLQ